MATVYSEGVVEIAVKMNYGTTPTVAVWHMKHDEELGSDSLEAMVRDFLNNWQDHVMLLTLDTVTLVGADWRSLDPVDNTVGTMQPNLSKAIVGAIPGPGAPPNVAWLFHKNTSNRPRGRRDGRCFLTGVDEAIVGEDGVLTSQYQSDANGALEDFYNGISDTSIDWAGDTYPVVLETTPASRLTRSQNGGVEPPPVTIGSRRVTSITIDPKVATQRDRLR